MNKKEKIDYINKINDFFITAKNHGNQGDNWWHPEENKIAYNVKIHSLIKTIEDIRKKMSKRQNDYYSDEMLYDITNDETNIQAEDFIQESKDEYNLKGGFAGRSGG